MAGVLKDVVLSTIIHIVWQIWHARNLARFENCSTSFHGAVNLISAIITLSGRFSTGKTNSNVDDFRILKHFSVSGHYNTAGKIIEVIWCKPRCGRVKCNSDGASRGNSGLASYGGISRDSKGAFMGCFSDFMGISTSF